MIGSIPVTFWPGMLITLALLFAFSWVLVRNVGLAVLVALSPWPGFVLAALGGDFPPSIFEYLPGFIAAGFLASAIAPLAANMPARTAARSALRDLWAPLLVVLLLFVPVFLTHGTTGFCIAGEISAVVVTALGAAVLPYNEEFVVRSNRAGEARLREVERLNFLSKSRWGMSIGGIALVFSVLGFFGAQRSVAAVSFHSVLFAMLALLFLVGAFFVSRNARRALAAFLAMVPVTLLIAALSDRFPFFSARLLLLLAVGAIPVLFMTAGALVFERNGDSWETATQRGIERFGPTVAVTAIAGAAATFLCEWPAGIAEAAALLLGGIAALILQPALTTMLYSLFPKRISLEEAFRKR